MEASHTLILYQNLLFADGLESILIENNFVVFKSGIPINSSYKLHLFKKAKIILVEENWPLTAIINSEIIDEMIRVNGSKVILISNIVNKFLLRLIQIGRVHGIVLKCSNSEELLFAIKQVLDGKKYYSSVLTNLLFKNNSEPVVVKVSKREKQILSLLAEMKSTSEIAGKLSISASTVKSHRRNLMQKFKAKNLLCLLRLACRENLLNEDSDYCGCCYKHFVGVFN